MTGWFVFTVAVTLLGWIRLKELVLVRRSNSRMFVRAVASSVTTPQPRRRIRVRG